MPRRNRSRSPRTVCNQWRANPLVNPRTGRPIVAQGPTFRALQAECQAPVVGLPVAARRSPRIRRRVAAPVAVARAESPCDRWRATPLINPRTGRTISLNGPTYRALERECLEEVAVRAVSPVRRAPSPVQRGRRRRASPVQRGRRRASPVRRDSVESYRDRIREVLIAQGGPITVAELQTRIGAPNNLTQMMRIIRLLAMGNSLNFVAGPTDLTSTVEHIQINAADEFRRAPSPPRRAPSPPRRAPRDPSPPRRAPRDPSPPRNAYGSRIMRILGEQYYRRGGPITVAELQTRIGAPNNLAQMMRSIRNLFTEYYSLNFVAGPTDLESTVEYRPFNAADVRRNRVPSPLPQVNRDARIKLGLEPRLSKQEKLQNLRQECSDMTDPISIEDFEDLSDDDIATVVKIGDRPPKHCYKLENIRSHLNRQQRQGLENKDPLNPSYIISRDEVREIMRN